MKFAFLILVTSIFNMPFNWQRGITSPGVYGMSNFPVERRTGDDSSQAIRIINGSSLKKLPAVIRDLSAALHETSFREELSLGGKGFSIYLHDVTCNSFENSASVLYEIGDTTYHLKLNRMNDRATDRALAATLIHEIMHCVLLDLCARAKRNEETAVDAITGFGLHKNDSSNFFNNDFFVLMNNGDEGQHELMYQVFYPRMVSLLERFASIHGEPFSDPRDAEYLMWSGLQKTAAYKNLSDEKKKEIELAILAAKRIDLARD